MFVGRGVSGTSVGAAVWVGVGEGLRLSPNKKNAPAARSINRSKPPPTNNRAGSRQLRPFSFSGWATTGGTAAAAPAFGCLPRVIVLGVVVIKVGSTTAAGLYPSRVVATGTPSLVGTCSKTTVILSLPPARFALSINSEVAAGRL